MALKSMTGFARASGADETLSWVWEVKSVNGKGLDARLRMPPGLEALEPDIRKALSSRFRRGNFQINLQVTRAKGAASLRINPEVLDWFVEEARKLSARLGQTAASVNPVELLSLRGVIEAEENGSGLHETHGKALLASLEEALDDLAKARAAEGARLQEVIAGHIGRIKALTDQARNDPARAPEAIRARLKEQIARIMDGNGELDEQRLYQEAAVIAARADIAEEIDRLDAHVAAARELMEIQGPAGRKLDFLAQEFNREANTLCSKAASASLSRTGLELKAVIDQLREQVANIE